jgi:uncharacterized protein YuzE
MQFHYSPTADALWVELRKGAKSARMMTVAPGVNVDFDADGKLVAVEVLYASNHFPPDELARVQRPA